MDNFQIEPQKQLPTRTFGPPEQLYLPPQKRKAGPIIAIVCVCAVLVVFAGIWYARTHSAAYKIGKGLANLAKEVEEMKNPLAEKLGMDEMRQVFLTEGNHTDTRLNFTFETDMLGEVTLGVDTDYSIDREAREMSASTELSVMNYEFAHVNLYGDDEVFCFSIPELLLEDMYVENENVLSQYNHSLWADDYFFGPAEGDDFSIELFPDLTLFAKEEGLAAAFLDRYDLEIRECREHMTIEKAGKDLYRVSFDSMYFNELIRQVLYDYVDAAGLGQEQAMRVLGSFNVISAPDDISFLFEIDNTNRIESIQIEEPLEISNGRQTLTAEIYFLGEERSIEKVQGRIGLNDDGGRKKEKSGEIVWQLVQSLDKEDYQIESDVKYSFTDEETETEEKAALAWNLNCRRNNFDTELTVKWPGQEVNVEAEGSVSNIEAGESFDLELEELLVNVDEEELLMVTGDITVEPLSKRVKQIVKPKIAFFEMSEREWEAYVEALFDEYSYFDPFGFLW